MANRIQIRRDTTYNWNAVNPVLADGELAYDIVTNEVRVGDGTRNWADLSGNVIGGSSGGTVSALTNGTKSVSLASTGTVSFTEATDTGILFDASLAKQILLAQNNHLDFANFSGEILVNDLSSGDVYKFLLGGGRVVMLGCTVSTWNGTISAPNATFTLSGDLQMEFNGGAAAYRFTNLNASGRTFNFVAIQSRQHT